MPAQNRRSNKSSKHRNLPFYRSETIAFLGISLVWVLLLYGKAIAAPFSPYDDPGNVVNNHALMTWHGTLKYFSSSSVFAKDLGGADQSYYRPLTWLSFFIDRQIWGLNAAGFHLTNVLLHYLNGILLFTLLRRLRADIRMAGAAALLWMALPINAEAVVWISSRAYSLDGFFLLLTGLLAHDYLASRKLIILTAYGLCTLCALLTYEAGFLVLPLTVLIAYASARRARRSCTYLFSAAIGASAFYIAVKMLLSGKASPHLTSLAPLGIYLFQYISWIVFPLHMSVERSTGTPSSHLSVLAILAWAAFLGLSVATYKLRGKVPWIAAGVAWLVVALLPFCGITYIYQGMAERFTYFASAGLALAVAGAVSSLVQSARLKPAWRSRVRASSIAAMCIWVLWGVAKLWQREGEWDNPIALYESSLIANPHSPKLFHNLGDVYLSQGDLDQARSSYEKALELSPDDTGVVIDLAATLQKQGDLAGAERQYQRAIAMDPAQDDSYCNLGVLLFQQGNTDAAIQLFSKAIKLSPDDPVPYFDLAAVYQNSGRRDLAIPLYQEVLRRNPDDQDAQARLKELGEM